MTTHPEQRVPHSDDAVATVNIVFIVAFRRNLAVGHVLFGGVRDAVNAICVAEDKSREAWSADTVAVHCAKLSALRPLALARRS